MGPVFFALSRLENGKGGEKRLARHYALAGAAVHPFYFIKDHARRFYQEVEDKEWKKDICEVFDGQGCFRDICQLLSNIGENESISGRQAIATNLRIAFPQREPYAL